MMLLDYAPIIHELPAEQYGATHMLEGQWREDRAAGWLTVTLLPGTMENDEFIPHPRIGWQEFRIGPERWADWLAFCEEWVDDTGQRPRATIPRTAALEYIQLVEAGLRPLED